MYQTLTCRRIALSTVYLLQDLNFAFVHDVIAHNRGTYNCVHITETNYLCPTYLAVQQKNG